jgi:dopamine D1-like receptor
LRKLGNLFLASLALADLFLASLVMTFAVANDMMGYWVFGDSFCEIWISFDVMCCTASILNLAAISLDRFFHIKDPLLYERWMTKRVILISVTGIWILSALVSFVPISLGWHRPSQDTVSLVFVDEKQNSLTGRPSYLALQSDMTENSRGPLPQCAMDLTPVYAVVSSLISFYIPCIIMIGLYTRLYLYAKKHVANIKSMTKSLQVSEEGLTRGDHSNLHKKTASEHKAAITLGVIMGTFLFCWVPFFIVNIIGECIARCYFYQGLFEEQEFLIGIPSLIHISFPRNDG